MNKLNEISNEELIRIFNMLKEYPEYIDNAKNKLAEVEEQKNARQTAKANR